MVVGLDRTVRYAISDLSREDAAYQLDAAVTRRMRWLRALRHWEHTGVDFIQLREKTLDPAELLALAAEGMAFLRGASARLADPARRPRLLMNGRPDLAAAAQADGVHLTSRPGELRPDQVREVFRAAGIPSPVVSVSCHTLADVLAARKGMADLLLFGPVFEKRIASERVQGGIGLPVLTKACQAAGPVPVLALGGVTAENTEQCLRAGASGVAGIRQFS